MPDDDLTASAASGEIAYSAGLATQLTRMLGSSKAEAFFVRFPRPVATLHWTSRLRSNLQQRCSLRSILPLKAAMEGETVRVMREFMTGDLDFLGFLDAKSPM